jgi:hypothetical protein
MNLCFIVDERTEAVCLLKDHILNIQLFLVQINTNDLAETPEFSDNKMISIYFPGLEMHSLFGLEYTEGLKAKWDNELPEVAYRLGSNDYVLEGHGKEVDDYLLACRAGTICKIFQFEKLSAVFY